MSSTRIASFKEFYFYYLSEHQNKTCRALHFIGTSLFFLMLFAFLFTLHWRYLLLMPLVGYGFAWIGHAFFEKNKPATFSYPLWSLASDFVMYWHTITGQLKSKILEAEKLYPTH